MRRNLVFNDPPSIDMTGILNETRGPRGPWNAHLRVKIFKSFLFSLLYIQQATPGGSKSDVMFKKEFSKI